MPADPLVNIVGSLAVDKYLTMEGTPGVTEKILHLWTVQKSGLPLLTDSMSIGEISVGNPPGDVSSNDTGTIGIRGYRPNYDPDEPDWSLIIHPYLVDENTLAYNEVDLTPYQNGYIDRFYTSMDGLEFVTQGGAFLPGNFVRGYSVDGTGTPWEVMTLGGFGGPGYMLGVPSAGRFIWADSREAYLAHQNLGTYIGQTVVGTNAYGSPTYDITYSYNIPALEDGEVVLAEYFDNYLSLGFSQYAYPPVYNPPVPATGGTLSFDGTVVNANLGAGQFVTDFVPYYFGYPKYQARCCQFSINNSLINWNVIPQEGTFNLTFRSTPPITGTWYNGGWGGFVPNAYYWPLPHDWYYENDYQSYFPIYQVRNVPHAKEIQLWSSDGEILDTLPFEPYEYATEIYPGIWNSYQELRPIWRGYWEPFGCGDAFYFQGWRRLTWANDTLALTDPTYDLNDVFPPETTGSYLDQKYGIWDGQVAIIWHDYQPSSGG